MTLEQKLIIVDPYFRNMNDTPVDLTRSLALYNQTPEVTFAPLPCVNVL